MSLLLPKRQKFRRQMRRKGVTKAVRGSQISFGEAALKVTSNGLLTSRQIESARKAITHFTKRGGKLWIRVFPDKPITKKAVGVRMGSGKGAVDHYAAVVTTGKVVFELSGLSREIMETALIRAAHKLPLQTKIFFKKDLL